MTKFPPLLLLPVLLFTGCVQYASVKPRQPVWSAPASIGSTGPARSLAAAIHSKSFSATTRLGKYLAAAQEAQTAISTDPDDTVARDAYNFAIARAIETIQQGNLDPWTKPLQLPDSAGGYVLRHRPDPRKTWHPALYQFSPADTFDIRGKYVHEHKTRAGVGAPLVAIGKADTPGARELFIMPRAFYGVTAILRFDGKTAEIAFEDPLASETTRLGGREMPMAADFSVPLAVMLASTDPKKLELSRLLRPAEYADTARIARLQPYDPDKTVVLVIHGLMDSQATWTPMINDLRGDPFIRKHYQFWFYSYPSGYPYPHSAAILRKNLDAIQKAYPLRKKMVVIGHSMGGCISRLLITDSQGDTLWRKIMTKAPGEMRMDQDARRLFEDALIFRPRAEVGRVIFISAPLKGSRLASNWIGRLGTRLVASPSNLLQAGNQVLHQITFQDGDLRLKEIPDSIDTLAPNQRFVRIINTFPVERDIPHHVICGDRGKGGNKEAMKPEMSDGIVPYWSSHMPTARSEKIVPSGHSAHQHPESFAEVARILRLHAASR